MTDIDRHRAEQLMQEAQMDALALFQPEAFRYAVGAAAGVATMWGRAGAAIALVPADPASRIAAVVSDHAEDQIRRAAPAVDLLSHRIWIDTVDLSGVGAYAEPDAVNAAYRSQGLCGPRPETFDRTAGFSLLGEALQARGLARGRIGVDLEFMPAIDFEHLTRALPETSFVDGSEVLRRLRAVKSPREIECLRRAARAAEGGLSRMAQAVSLGVSVGDLSAAWKAGAVESARAGGFPLSGHWDFLSVGPDLSDMRAVVSEGALIKADVGTLVDGYSSDGARTFSFGKASPLALRIFDALEQAFEAGLERLKPGNSFASVHHAMMAAMRRAGFDEYARGHFGHSVGAGVGIEEWPFFSAESSEIIRPNMVVALEAPFYAQGLGALMIEDQFLITQQGAEPMNSLPRGLLDLSLR